MEIAIDFDGTCVLHDYPSIGRDIGAVPVLQKLAENGHRLILYTMRSGGYLSEAIEWFNTNKIPLYGAQVNPTQHKWTESTKCFAHLYIDDAALGAPLLYDKESGRNYIDWSEVTKLLHTKGLL